MGATGRSSTYRRWRRRTDSSSVLHLLAVAHLCGCLALCRRGEKEKGEDQRHRERPPWGRGAGREHPSSTTAGAPERSRERSTVVTGG
jgi:hypothetical protein